MTVVFELDGLRLEVRAGIATPVEFWPTSSGAGRITVSATAADNTFTVYDPSGTAIQGPTNATVDNTSGASKLTATLSAISALDEGYRITWKWKESGSTFEHASSLFFDVVTEPWGPPRVTLEAMAARAANLLDRVRRQARALGRTEQELAAKYALDARSTLDGWLRGKIAEESSAAQTSGRVTSDVARIRYVRPRLILDRERLLVVELKLAIANAFRADMNSREDADDKASALYAFWRDDAEASFRGLGGLAYDFADDLKPTATIASLGSTVRMRRRQG